LEKAFEKGRYEVSLLCRKDEKSLRRWGRSPPKNLLAKGRGGLS